MEKASLQHSLTEEERRIFNETGYLVIENALSSQQVEALTMEVDRITERKINEGHDTGKALMYTDFVKDHQLFLDLVDYDKILPKVWGILGWNIYMYHTHMIVTHPSGQEKNDKTFSWHQDSGRVNKEIETHPRPRLSLKVAYFLSDLSVPDRGNFWIIPNSHLQDNIQLPEHGIGIPAGAIPVCVKPGTAVFFDRRLWHAASTNWSDITRKVLFYGYGYRWIRRKDDMTMVNELIEKSDPIRSQMLGDGLNCNGYYTPTDGDVPLKVWLQEQGLEV
jgi:ectoine hydroxylase